MSIWVGRYAIVEGEVREHGPWLVESERLRDDEQVQLIVLAEPADRQSHEFCSEVANAVADLFTRESLSITGGLLRAMQQAHANLSEWNRRSLREHQIAVGLTCVAIRGGEATIAQAGPSIAFVAEGDHVTRLATAGEPAERPLGASEPVEPQFHTTRVDNRQILLMTTNVEDRIGTEGVERALSVGPERALAELFLQTRELRDVTAALIADLDLPELLEGGDGKDAYPAPAARPAPSEASAPSAPRGAPPPYDPPPRAELPSSAPAERRLPTAAAGDQGRRRSSGALPSSGPMPALRRPRLERRSSIAEVPWRWLLVAGAAVLAIVVAALFVIPPLLDEDRGNELDEALAAAETHLLQSERARDDGDVATRRTELEAALAEITRALSVAPDEQRVAAIENAIVAQLTELDAVVQVSTLREVVAFEGVLTAPLTPIDLVVGGGVLWLVDGERGRIFAIDPAGRVEPTEVYRAGEQYSGVDATEPLVVAWEPTSGRLLVLDEARTLFALAPGREPELLPLRDIGEVNSVQAMATYTGNLYILDPASGEVWRYLPAGAGFDSERSELLGGARIEDAVDLVVDGDLYLLADGSLRHFQQGQELAPLLQGIDEQPTSVAGIVEDRVRGTLYVGDRGGRRVVTGDLEGLFLQQYRHADFFDLRGIALGEDGATLYVLTGNGVFAFDPLATSAQQ